MKYENVVKNCEFFKKYDVYVIDPIFLHSVLKLYFGGLENV